MKKLWILFAILFSLVTASAEQTEFRWTSDDFDLFPLNIRNSDLLEGVWSGETVEIDIRNTGYVYQGRPYMRVLISNKVTREHKSAVLFYHVGHKAYELYVFGTGKSVPLQIMIRGYKGDLEQRQTRSNCTLGKALMMIRFSLSGSLNPSEGYDISLMREACAVL